VPGRYGDLCGGGGGGEDGAGMLGAVTAGVSTGECSMSLLVDSGDVDVDPG
jgi:hypothetical protein